MTISSTTRKAGPFIGNGVATDFVFDFKLFSTSDLRVVRADALGVETDLVHVTDCTVTLNADQDENPGGSVVLNAPLADGFRLVLLSAVPELQPVDLTNQGGFYPELVNGGLDRNTVLVQQLREQMGRSITVPVTADPGDLALPSPAAGQLLAWSDDGLTNLDPSSLISVVAYGSTYVDKFDGDGTTAVFALSASPGVQNNLRVSIDGVVQVPSEDFTWGGGTALTFGVAPPADTRIVAQYQEALLELGSANADFSNVDPATGRLALGLADAATRDVGTTAGTVAAGDDPRFSASSGIDKDAGNMSAPEKVTFRTAMALVRGATAEQGADATAAANAAYAAGIPFFYGGAEEVPVTLDFSSATTDADRFAILDGAQKWQASCVTTGLGEVTLVIPDGLHSFGTGAILRGANSPTLNLRATAAPDEIAITSITVALVSGTLYTVTVGLGAALPAGIVADHPVGMLAITGNNDAASFSGALKIATIAGNRLSFTAQTRFPSAPTAPTTLTAGTTNSQVHNTLFVPKAALAWSGGTASIEGFINFLDGGRGTDKNLGWVYAGSSADGTMFYLGQGASWDSADKSVYCGGPERIFRLFNDALYTANRCAFGGGNHTATNSLIDSQSGGKLTVKRCALGGGILRQVLVGQGTQAELAQNWITGGSTAVIENAGGWITDLSVTSLYHSAARGIYTRQGGVTLLAATTTIAKATTGLAWLGLARYEGSPAFGTGVTTQGTGPANSMRNGGVWQATTTAPIISNKLALAPGSSNDPINNGEMEIEATSNTSAKIKLKGSDGVIRSVTFTLA